MLLKKALLLLLPEYYHTRLVVPEVKTRTGEEEEMAGKKWYSSRRRRSSSEYTIMCVSLGAGSGAVLFAPNIQKKKCVCVCVYNHAFVGRSLGSELNLTPGPFYSLKIDVP